MPPAARLTDLHVCPIVGAPGPIKASAATVKIGFLPAARVGDPVECPVGPDEIAAGSATVKIDGVPAARIGDPTKHGGTITTGMPTVSIG